MEQNSKDRWFVVFNPMAGSSKAAFLWKEIAETLYASGVKYESYIIRKNVYAAGQVCEAVKNGFRRFVAVGGDGTINQVLAGLRMSPPTGERLTMAVIPIGSGNDWIKLYGIPKDYREAVRLIAGDGLSRGQDIGNALFVSSGKRSYMMNIAGVGLDAYVCDVVNKMKSEGKRGKRIYVEGLARAFFSYKCRKAKVFCDGEPVYQGKMLSLSIGNGRYTGGGMLQTPDAIPDDGLFDICIIKHIPFGKLIFKVKKLFDGTLPSDPYVIMKRCRSVRVEAEPESLVEIDGEVLGSTPVLFENEHLAIDVIVPRR